MRLHGVRRAGCTTDSPTQEHVVAQEEVSRQLVAHRRSVRLDPDIELLARAVLEQLDAIALVVVEHEGGQKATDVGPHDRSATEVVALRVRLLAEDGDVVPSSRPLARELTRVDVRARPAEQIPVPDEDLHAK